MRKTLTFTYKEVLEKLKWYHGEEFEKYPLTEEFKKALRAEKVYGF